MSRPLSMTDTAAEVGLSYERFRKIWRALSEAQEFPAPLHGRKWDREAVAAWKIRRSSLRVAPVAEIRAAAHEPEVRAANSRRARAASALHELRSA